MDGISYGLCCIDGSAKSRNQYQKKRMIATRENFGTECRCHGGFGRFSIDCQYLLVKKYIYVICRLGGPYSEKL